MGNLIAELVLNGKRDDIQNPIFLSNSFVRIGKIKSVEKIELIHKKKNVVESVPRYILEYDTQGLLRVKSLNGKDQKIVFHYDKNGYFTGMEELEYNELPFGGISISSLKIKEEKTFSNRGVVLQKKTFFEDGNVHKSEYIYEKKWLISEIKEYDEKNNLIHHFKFKYSFY
jgi:hypothetical protein